MHKKYHTLKRYYMLLYAKYLKGKYMLPGQTGRIKKGLGKEHAREVLNTEKES